jgi:phosphoglycolate phosphatase
MRLALFDIDGTLLHGTGVGVRAMERAGRRVLGPEFSLSGIDFAGGLDTWIYGEAARSMKFAAAKERHSEFHDAYLEELARQLVESRPPPSILPGVAEALSYLCTLPSVTLGLVTGNYRRAAPMKLRAVGIDPDQFTIGAFGDEAETRPELVRLALHRWKALGKDPKPEHVVVVGDTPRDVHCAQSNGCRCLAVATGRHSVAELEAAGADIVARDLTDLSPLLALLGVD